MTLYGDVDFLFFVVIESKYFIRRFVVATAVARTLK